ncbi:MAG: DNA repair protein RadC [Candidatus Aenigmarchaeota archaeon]|nr:DNA repair protein RadC [Candidatus Aenigmarchaeota archaeon]
MGMKDIPTRERPRERMMMHGVGILSNSELLSAVLGFGSKNESVLHLSNKILAEYSLGQLSQASVNELGGFFGISKAKACRIIAALELGRRATSEKERMSGVVEYPADVARLMNDMRNSKQESFRGVYLDSKMRIIKEGIISIGGLNTNSFHPREVFGPALIEAAEAVILVHNHPSGDPAPSKDDIKATARLTKAGKMLGVEVLDHIIIGKDGYVSLKESGML